MSHVDVLQYREEEQKKVDFGVQMESIITKHIRVKNDVLLHLSFFLLIIFGLRPHIINKKKDRCNNTSFFTLMCLYINFNISFASAHAHIII